MALLRTCKTIDTSFVNIFIFICNYDKYEKMIWNQWPFIEVLQINSYIYLQSFSFLFTISLFDLFFRLLPRFSPNRDILVSILSVLFRLFPFFTGFSSCKEEFYLSFDDIVLSSKAFLFLGLIGWIDLESLTIKGLRLLSLRTTDGAYFVCSKLYSNFYRNLLILRSLSRTWSLFLRGLKL
jgi:hypothetical protein